MKKNQTILTAAALLAGLLLSACGEAAETPKETERLPAETDAGTEAETQEQYPAELSDFGGYTLRFLNQEDDFWNGTTHILDYEKEIGDRVPDAIYRRNRQAENDLNFKIEVTKVSLDNNNEPYHFLSKAVQAGEDAYDAAYCCLNYSGTTLMDGQLTHNLHDINALRLAEPWWNRGFIESATVGDNELYTTIDNINLMGVAWANCLLFSIDMFRQYDLEMPYDMIRAGTWTYEKMFSFMKYAVNLNADSDWAIDRNGTCVYGFATEHSGGPLAIFEGSGEYLIHKDENNLPILDIGNERLINAFDVLHQNFSQPGFCVMHNTSELQGQEMFTSGRAMFTQTTLGGTTFTRLRNTDVVYGMVPYPKADEAQDTYYHAVSQYTLALGIPVTVGEPEKIGTMLDYLAFLSWRDILPSLFESFCYKGARDEDSIEMISLIQNSQVIDIGVLYGWTTDLLGSLCGSINKGNNNLVSKLASSEKSIQKKLDKFLADRS